MTELHPVLQRDTYPVGQFRLCRLLLMRDANYPWFILVPERNDIIEIYQLPEADQLQLMRESAILSAALAEVFKPDKINIAALGNIVPQLHIHHVVRYITDKAWPAPVWGAHKPVPYTDVKRQSVVEKLYEGLVDAPFFIR